MNDSHSALYRFEGEVAQERDYLQTLGDRVRTLRARRGMTRKNLARDSGVSERYLALLESGRGNISIMLLRALARALDTPLDSLVQEAADPPLELFLAAELLRRLPASQLPQAYRMLSEAFGEGGAVDRRNRIGLIGLRGAGKSTLGALLAEKLGCPFVELDREIEQEAGAPLNAIFDLYGQVGFRRLERRCLDRVIADIPRAVIATGGGLVSDSATYERLLSSCFTVWIKASPAEHMERVVAQGDMRPMADNREAMADLQRILQGREQLYGRADGQLDTSDSTVQDSLGQLLALVAHNSPDT